jgi:hypothetical protein
VAVCRNADAAWLSMLFGRSDADLVADRSDHDRAAGEQRSGNDVFNDVHVGQFSSADSKGTSGELPRFARGRADSHRHHLTHQSSSIHFSGVAAAYGTAL